MIKLIAKKGEKSWVIVRCPMIICESQDFCHFLLVSNEEKRLSSFKRALLVLSWNYKKSSNLLGLVENTFLNETRFRRFRIGLSESLSRPNFASLPVRSRRILGCTNWILFSDRCEFTWLLNQFVNSTSPKIVFLNFMVAWQTLFTPVRSCVMRRKVCPLKELLCGED